MSTFRKWLTKKAFPDPATQGFVQYEYCGDAWQAALKEVLKQTERTNRGRIGIIDWIEKELQEDYGMPPIKPKTEEELKAFYEKYQSQRKT